MNRYISVMIQVFPWYIREIFVRRFRIPTPIKLPARIRRYRLLKILSSKGFPFGTGLYINKIGQEVVIKIWQAKSKDIYYFDLLHQIQTMKILTAVQNRIPKEGRFGFSTPNHIASSVGKNQVVLIMEKVDGTSMEDIKDEKVQFDIYRKCLLFLQTLSHNLTNDERKAITTKSVWDFLFLYPIILVTALIIQPKLIVTLLKGVPLFLIGIPMLSKLRPNTLVHGDLHPDNILVLGNNKFSLIDVENMRLCYGLYEPISTISLKGNSPKFKQLVTANFIRPHYSFAGAKQAIRSLIVNSATHNLSGDKNELGIASYKQLFNLAFSL